MFLDLHCGKFLNSHLWPIGKDTAFASSPSLLWVGNYAGGEELWVTGGDGDPGRPKLERKGNQS